MPTIGSYDYPDTSVDNAIEAAKKIARQFKTGPFDRTALSATLGFKSASSGGFNQKLADLRRFGVLEGRGDDMRASDLAQRLTAPSNAQEYSVAVTELVFKIPLYKALYDSSSGLVPNEDEFFATLLNITKAERIEVQNQAVRIRNLLVEALGRIGGVATMPQSVARPSSSQHPLSPGQATARDLIEFRAGQLHQSFPFTPDGVDQMARICGDEGFWKFLRGLAESASKMED